MRISTQKAIELLRSGHVVAVPTETVYGLASSAFDASAIEKIYQLKNRPSANPLIIHINSYEDLRPIVLEMPPLELCQTFWPGPLTLVLPIDTSKVPSIARAGLATGAFRVPSHPLARQVIEGAGPIVMPSANISGKPSATQPEHVEQDFGSDFPVVDGGKCVLGLESTIVIYNQGVWEIIRQGALSKVDLKKAIGYEPNICIETSKKPLCPGQMYRHYAPKAKLYFGSQPGNCEAVLGFSDRHYGCPTISMGSLTQPAEVAQKLYSALRQLDEMGYASAWVDMDFPKEGILLTVEERLRKAANH